MAVSHGFPRRAHCAASCDRPRAAWTLAPQAPSCPCVSVLGARCLRHSRCVRDGSERGKALRHRLFFLEAASLLTPDVGPFSHFTVFAGLGVKPEVSPP